LTCIVGILAVKFLCIPAVLPTTIIQLSQSASHVNLQTYSGGGCLSVGVGNGSWLKGTEDAERLVAGDGKKHYTWSNAAIKLLMGL
jgi:hypothetical protein